MTPATRIAHLWDDGYNTLQIARKLKIEEYEVDRIVSELIIKRAREWKE